MKKVLIGNREKSLIHVAKAQLGMTEEAYRDMLSSVGVSSSKELDQAGFDEIMTRLRAAGFRPEHKSARKSGMHREPAPEKKPMISKIGAILAELGLPWSYADSIARNMFGADRLAWCDSEQTHKILQALIIHQRRKRMETKRKE